MTCNQKLKTRIRLCSKIYKIIPSVAVPSSKRFKYLLTMQALESCVIRLNFLLSGLGKCFSVMVNTVFSSRHLHLMLKLSKQAQRNFQQPKSCYNDLNKNNEIFHDSFEVKFVASRFVGNASEIFPFNYSLKNATSFK